MDTGKGEKEPARDDLALVRAALAGRKAAVEELLERLRCVRRMLVFKNERLGAPLGHAELDDLAQETLFAVWRKLETFSGRGSLEAWAFGFCFLELLARVRQHLRRPLAIEDLPPDALAEPAAPEARDPFALEEVYLGLERLGPPDSDLIRMKTLDDLSFEEIARREAVPVNTVKTRYYRGLERLRRLVGARPRPERMEERA